MRNKILSLLAVCAIAVPAVARAQALEPGSQTEKIIFVYTGEVLPGQEQAFRDLAAKVAADVEHEPGTLVYRWSMRDDGKTFDVVEIYKDSNAVVAHINDVLPKFGKELGKAQKETRFIVYGEPDAAARKALDPLHPEYEKPFAGFIR